MEKIKQLYCKKRISAPLRKCAVWGGLCVSLSLGATPYWWGAAVGLGANQPYKEQAYFDLHTQDENNQLVPLFLSSDGVYRWSDSAFVFSVAGGEISRGNLA